MVQLHATAAIEYVAAGHFFARGSFDFWPGDFCPGVLLSGGSFARGTFVRGAYARSPQVQCIYEPSRLSVPSIVAWRTNKRKNRQTRPRSSAGSTPPLPKFSGYVEVEGHYIFHPNTIWVRPLCMELGRVRTIPKKAPNTQYPIILAYPNANTQYQYQYRCMMKHWIECKSKTVQVNILYVPESRAVMSLT